MTLVHDDRVPPDCDTCRYRACCSAYYDNAEKCHYAPDENLEEEDEKRYEEH